MFIHRILVFVLSLCLFSWMGTAQTSIESLADSLQQEALKRPSELVYLQTGKGIYETGEDLWFKGYQLDAQSFGLSDKSKTLYLQLINPKDSVVWEEKYLVENGLASGHIYLDEKLSEGDYFLQGYTRGSFYSDDTIGKIAQRKIKVVKKISENKWESLSKDSAFRFEMFAEGGNLVSGISSRLSFKATDGKGDPMEVEGVLYEDDKVLNTIKSVHDGMGSLLFTPFEGRRYHIEIKDKGNYPLPEVHSEGMTLQLLKQDKKRLDFIVTKSAALPSQQIYLVGQMRGMVCCIAQGTLKNSLKIPIPLDNFFYQGIAEFTLFDSSMQPVAERLVYIHPEKKLHITAEAEKKSFITREKGVIKIKVTDEEGKPVRANLGVSVYDQAYDNLSDAVDILSYCYLSTQIRGKIHNPGYYFDKENRNRLEALDLLLLTQGWRRYVWGLHHGEYFGKIFLTDEIAGIQRLKSKKKNKLTQSSEQLIQVSGAEGNSAFVWADSTGCFTVSTDMMKDLRGGYVYLKPMLSKEFKPELEIVDYFPLIDSLRKNKPTDYPVMDLSQQKQEQILSMPVVSGDSVILLNEVVVTRKAIKPFRDKFMGQLDSLASLDLSGAWVCDCGSHTGHGYLNDYNGYSHHPAGSPCPPVKHRSKPVNGVDYELIKYEPKGPNGEWIVTDIVESFTYQGPEFAEEELLRMNNLWRTKGFYAAREFYQPDEVDMQISMPDARNTLLWQPSVITDEKGEATVSFYCSDINTEFIGVVEGVDGAGLLGTGKCKFRVIRR